MTLNQKVKLLREDKKLSQSYIAHELAIEQSQYSRREKGEIQFIPDEIIKLSKLLEITIASLFEEKATVLNNIDIKGGDFAQYISASEKLIEQYELRIKEKDDIISLLRQKI